MSESVSTEEYDKYDLSGLFNEAWLTDDLYVKINGYDIPTKDILTHEIFWDGRSAHGVVSFEDWQDIYGQAGLKTGFLETGWTSQPNTKLGKPSFFSERFVITETNQSPNQDGRYRITTIYFEDFFSHKLDVTYHNEAYTGDETSKTLAQYYEDIKADLAVVTPVNPKDDKKIDIVTPGHITAKRYIQEEADIRGYDFILDKYSNYLVHTSNFKLDKLKSTGEFFDYKGNDVSSRTNIIEYSTTGFNSKAITNSPVVAKVDTNVDTAEIGDDDESSKNHDMQVQYEKDEKLNESERRAGKGRKLSDGTDNSDGNNDSLADMQRMTMWVPGWNGNRIMMTVDVELPLPTTISEGSSKTARGKWVVEAVRDKIINGYFLQQLYLVRGEDN